MGNISCTEKCHKMLIGVDESTGMCPVWLDIDLFFVLYKNDRKFIPIYKPTCKGYTIDNKLH